jgi:tripartite-type tricarboxylate transporter receptor subunit TctC
VLALRYLRVSGEIKLSRVVLSHIFIDAHPHYTRMIYKVKTLAMAGNFKHLCLKLPAIASVLIFLSLNAFAHEDAIRRDTGVVKTDKNWPSRTIKVIVPFPAGGFADSMTRIVAPALATALEEPVVVENRAGGNGMTGYVVAADAPADGYTWLSITLTHAINQSLFPNTFPALGSAFKPVAMLAASPLVVVVNPNVKATTLSELAALAKRAQQDKPITAGSSGNGTPPHIGLALLEEAFGADILHIPYKGGAPSITDLLSHQVDMIVANLPEALAHIRAGKLRALAVTADKRSAFLPDVPTTLEAGYPSIRIENWMAFMMPAATPQRIVARVTIELDSVMSMPATKQKLDALGFTSYPLAGEPLATFLNQEVTRWSNVVRMKKIKAE